MPSIAHRMWEDTTSGPPLWNKVLARQAFWSAFLIALRAVVIMLRPRMPIGYSFLEAEALLPKPARQAPARAISACLESRNDLRLMKWFCRRSRQQVWLAG